MLLIDAMARSFVWQPLQACAGATHGFTLHHHLASGWDRPTAAQAACSIAQWSLWDLRMVSGVGPGACCCSSWLGTPTAADGWCAVATANSTARYLATIFSHPHAAAASHPGCLCSYQQQQWHSMQSCSCHEHASRLARCGVCVAATSPTTCQQRLM